MFDPMTLRPRPGHEAPVSHLLNEAGRARALLICDHASNSLPEHCPDLGLDETQMHKHIAWDLGAAAVSRRLSVLLDAPAVLAGVSRLYVDCNRHPDDPSVIAAESDAARIPGNEALDAAARAERLRWHENYHTGIERVSEKFHAPPPLMVFIHSFTPRIAGESRPWHIGVLYNTGSDESAVLLRALRADKSIIVGDNKPYSLNRPKSHSVYRHAIDRDRPYVALEIRHDLIETEAKAEVWADYLADVLVAALAPWNYFSVN